MNENEKNTNGRNDILVVDDNPANLQLLMRSLTDHGYHVRPASSGFLALRSVAAKAPDLILLDVKMPEMDGFEVCRRLKADQASRDIPVLFISALNESVDKINGFAAGGLDYITKPFEEEELLARVETHLQLHELTEHLEQKVRERTEKLADANFKLQQEISERNLLEDELREALLYSRNLLESSLDPLVTISPDGKITDANAASEKVTGVPRAKLIGTDFSDYFTDPDKAGEGYRQALDIGFVTDYPLSIKHLNGQITDVIYNASLYRNKDGSVAGVFASARDITQLKQAEEEKERLQERLYQAQKLESIGILAGGIAHEFNNLLQAILGYNSLILLDKAENDKDCPNLRAIQMTAQRAALLVRQLLLFSRRVEVQRRPLDLNQEVEQARRMLERIIPKTIDIDVHPGSRLWAVKADPIQIQQVLLNLGNNAADAMPAGGKLIIETANLTLDEGYAHEHLGAAPGNYVLLTVSDTGLGIDRKTIQHIFEPFFTTKEIGRGTGLGLAAVYGIVKSHGGFITCYSEVGQGTTFKIYLSAIEQKETISDSSSAGQLPVGGTETILLADDEPSIRNFASKALQHFGYTVIVATSGEEAVEIFSSAPKQINLVILDIGMPGMGGYQCLQELLNIDQAAKVVIASGYSVADQLKKSLEAGAAGFVRKPYQLNDLLDNVRAVLDGRE
ncbi:MAG: response regulator [Deltaproteobacteria bacterium]|nr:response regulator [Deltaproteobacteria bacterium]